MGKTYADTYLFSVYNEYSKKMMDFIMKAERIDTTSKEFDDVLYDVKRRKISDSLAKIITSKNVILGIGNGKPLPKSFKAFTAKDIKEDKNSYKCFIDVTDAVVYKNGVYVCNKMEWLISYVINGMVQYIYKMNENKLMSNSSILKDGGEAWVRCFSYIIDRLYKISSVRELKQKVDYVAGLYYQVNILGKDYEKSFDSIKANAIRFSDIDTRQAQLVDNTIEKGDFYNLDHFIKAIGRIFTFKDITVDAVVGLWMNAFGTGTVFALEFFPAFSHMMTNTYIGGYIDQQITIEKVAGPSMVKFTKTILQIGASV